VPVGGLPDKLAERRSIRILIVIDQFTRECVWLEADRSMNGSNAVTALTRAIGERGATPDSITLDNGSEFAGHAPKRAFSCAFIRAGRPA
jgi:putative transposase